MKRELTAIVKMEGSLKVKRRVIVHAHQNKAHDLKDGNQSNMILSTKHITVEENPCSDSSYSEVNEAPHELEDGIQSTIDELEELN